ncbi:MAG: hypothetical protein KatS3mg008_0395 [Acidimicrobiales bacterium]|nr:MAG: hypothetical protein KatS3mg008_0395 [Acidimicrobiales bacterium]
MALQGTLETFSLPDVLRLLANTGKTGQLRLSGDRGTGSVWLSEGKIVKCEASGAPHADRFVDVLFELLRFRQGDFLFDTDGPAEAGEAVEVEPLLAEAEELLAEWRQIEAVVPSLRSWITLEPELPGDSVTLDAERWQIVTAVGHGSDVASLMDRLRKPELAVTRLVKDLVDAGLARVGEPPADVLSGEPSVVTSHGAAATVTPEASVTAVGVAEVPQSEVQPTDTQAGGQEAPAAEYEAVAAAATSDFAAGGVEEAGELEEFERELAAEAEAAEEASAVVGATEEEAEEEEVSSADLLSMGSLDTADPEEAVEIARQLANLSPRAARAVAAAAKASTREERERALAAIDGMDDEINKELLLKFLSGGS